jgi:histidinol-phosphate aminotransferase
MSPTRQEWFVSPPHLEGLDRFEPGKHIAEVQRELGLERVVKLASNENPLGPSPTAIEAARAAMADAHRYPDAAATELRAALSAHLGVPSAQVIVGSGSVDVIDLLAKAFLGPGDNAVISEHAFARFRQIVDARNRGARLVPMREWTHDLPAMGRAVDDRTRLVFVANPNNPTGTWNRRAEVAALVAALPPGVLLVLDEAYFEYADDPEYPDGIDLVRGGAPVVVTRTFSKAHGLGGLRVGYGVAVPEVIEALLVVREPFCTNAVAQAAATAALTDTEHVRRSLELNRAEKARLAAALTGRGHTVLPSLGNFLTFDTGEEGRDVFRRLLTRGVIVRPLDPYGMRRWLRVSIGTPEENAAFLEALEAVSERSKS